MNKNNGFTLVELLAVIVILAVLGILTVPKINNTINDNRNKSYKEIEQRLEEAAERYILNNYIDSNINTITITKQQLIDAALIDEVYDLKDKTVCDASIVVSNINTNIEYKAILDCSNYTTE